MSVAVASSIVCLVVCMALFPIPIHGGVMFFFEVVWHELLDWKNSHEVAIDTRKADRFRQSLEGRFKGTIAYEIESIAPQKDWVEVRVSGGIQPWKNESNGLVWSDPVVWKNGPSRPSLEEAKTFCQSLEPVGYWALPTEAEMSLFWKANQLQKSVGR